MNRLTIQAVLCVALCPLLVAQQTTSGEQSPTTPDLASAGQPKVAAITIPRKTVVELALLETVSSATAQKGQAVRLVVKKDVVVNGTVVIPRGTPASGLVTFVRKGVAGKSDGSLRVKPLGLILPDGSSIELRGYTYNDDDADGVCEGFVSCLGLNVIVVSISLPFAIAYSVTSLFQRHHAAKPGIDQTLAVCSTLLGSTKAKSHISRVVPDQGGLSQPTTEVDSTCSEQPVPIPSLSPALPQGMR
jgi:hypothetical protein